MSDPIYVELTDEQVALIETAAQAIRIAQQELNKDAAAIRSPEEAEAAGATVRHLLGRTLTADAAVQIALLNNRGLQAAYDELAIADAERVGQSLPPNPTFSWRRIQAGAALESELQLVTNLIALATLPARSEIAAQRFHQAQLRAAEETLRVAHEARRAFYRAVAARELVHFVTESRRRKLQPSWPHASAKPGQ